MKKITKLAFFLTTVAFFIIAAALSVSAASCGENAPWSDWTDTKPTESEYIAIEEATFYRYRTKTTTTSTSASLEGWEKDGSSVSYGDWQDASWTKTKPTEGDTLQITNTKTVTDKAAYYTYTYFRYVSSDGKTAAYDKRSGWTYQTITLTYELAKKGNTNNGTNPAYYGPYAGEYGTYLQNIWYRNDSTYKKHHDAVTHTEWFYQTRTKTTTYKYYKWSDWSDYSQTEPEKSSVKEIEPKTMYRYRYVKHELGEEKVLTQPTCVADGTYVRGCKNCGEFVYFSIPKTGHTYNSGKVTKQPTCTKTGVKTYTCTVCGHKKTKTLAKADHTYKKVTTKATLKENGSVVSKCAVCGKVASSKTVYRIKTVKLSETSYLVNGKVQKPTVTVKNSKGKAISSKYYTVSYSNKSSKAVGTYTVTVTFKGVYEGTKTLKYKITAPAKVTGIKQYVEKGICFRWDKVSGADGYEVYISPASESNYKKVATQTSNSLKNPKINSSIKVKVRAYVTVDGKKIYGEFSKAVTLDPIK